MCNTALSDASNIEEALKSDRWKEALIEEH